MLGLPSRGFTTTSVPRYTVFVLSTCMNLSAFATTITPEEVTAAPGYVVFSMKDDQFEADRNNLGQELMYGEVVSVNFEHAFADAAVEHSYPKGVFKVGDTIGVARSKTIKLSYTSIPMYAVHLPFVILVVNAKERTV